MTLPSLISREEIHHRLEIIFPVGSPRDTECRSLGAATVIFGCLYVGAVEGSGRFAGPMRIVRMSDERANNMTSDQERLDFLKKPAAVGKPWYADNSRETIRDDIIRASFTPIGAITARAGLATNSGNAGYALASDFVTLFAPGLTDVDVDALAADWRARHFAPAALTRVALQRHSASSGAKGMVVSLPTGEARKLEPGPSSEIIKAVVEEFATRFLSNPAILWISESASKVAYRDDERAKAVGIDINAQRVLPDMILVDVSKDDDGFMIVFVEVVATDGPMTDSRVSALRTIATTAGYKDDQIAYVTAFHDRKASAFRKAFVSIAWDTFVWFATEPDKILLLADGEGHTVSLQAFRTYKPS